MQQYFFSGEIRKNLGANTLVTTGVFSGVMSSVAANLAYGAVKREMSKNSECQENQVHIITMNEV